MYVCVVSPVVCCWCIMRKIRYLYQIPWYPGNYRKSYHTRRDDGHYSWKDLQVPDFAFDALQLVGTLWKRSPIEIYCLFLLHFCLTPESRVAQCKEALLWGLNKLLGFVFTKSCTNYSWFIKIRSSAIHLAPLVLSFTIRTGVSPSSVLSRRRERQRGSEGFWKFELNISRIGSLSKAKK